MEKAMPMRRKESCGKQLEHAFDFMEAALQMNKNRDLCDRFKYRGSQCRVFKGI
ncbi:MAG: hypothetical protein ACLT4E_10815 [Clostridium sp.]